jgi:hypothetical protein
MDYAEVFEVDFPIYALTIERFVPRTSEQISKFDFRILNTILYILNEFFSFNQNATLFLYDTLDERQSARKRLFDNWYKKYNTVNLIKMEKEVLIDTHKTTAALLYSPYNANKDKLIACFNKIIEESFYC